jgi:hypothetical protein
MVGGAVVGATAGCTGAVVVVRANGDVAGEWCGGRVVVVVRRARGFGWEGLVVVVAGCALGVVVVGCELGRRRTGLVVAVG